MKKYWTSSTIAMMATAGSAILAEPAYTREDGAQIDAFETFRDCDVCPVMIVVPLGEFTMGAPPEESAPIADFTWNQFPSGDWLSPEGPQHRVVIDIPIAIGKNEVTLEEWSACVNDGGCPDVIQNSRDAENGDLALLTKDHPIVGVSYRDAQNYLEWLNIEVKSEAYRLPTEAEWEYAARAGTQTPFSRGQQLEDSQANFSSNGELGTTFPVTEFDAANSWGFRHMAGNAFELTMSCWADRHPQWSTSRLHYEQARISTCRRVTKGGSYNSRLIWMRHALRGNIPEDYRAKHMGFRVAKELQEWDISMGSTNQTDANDPY